MSRPAAMDRRRRTIMLAVKAGVTALLVGIAFGLADLSAVASHFRTVDLPLLGLAIFLMLGNTLLEAIQFAEIVRALSGRVTLGASFAISLAGRFFGTVSPAGVGSDVYRALAMRHVGMPAGEAVSLALASRLMSFLALVPVLAAGAPLAFAYADGVQERAMLVSAPILVLAILTALVGSGRIAGKLPLRWSGSLRGAADALVTAAAGSPRSPAIWLAALGQHVIRVIIFAIIADALGIAVPLDALFAFVPVSLLVAMIPVTLGSWGLRELSLVYTLGLSGLEAGAALATSVTFGGTALAYGALCGLFWVSNPVRP